MSQTPRANRQRTVALTRLDHVQLAIPANAEDRARAFYVGLLGFDEMPKPPELAKRGGAWFRSGEIVLHVGVESDFRPAKKAHPAFRCADYAATITYLRECGVAIVPDENPFDAKPHCYIEDPFGNRIELIAE